ncbi:HNH endonuclease signature motif containing protein [Arthrobacter sp. MMS24-T111]
MANSVVARALADIQSAIAMLTAEVEDSGSLAASDDVDPLQGLAEGCLDVMACAAKAEAQLAALKVRAVAAFADAERSAAPPDAPVQAQEMAVAAEVGCALAISHRAAGALLAESYALARSLPLTLAALGSGHISWQHARTMVEQTASLEPAAAGALEAHFLDPDALNRARGCPIGEMPAYRFKAKARIWRERHHPESLEARHAKSAADRRVGYAPECDGMAWISAYLPAATASAIWNRTTAVARGLQGTHEARSLSQLRADVLSAALLTGGGSADLQEGYRGQVPRTRAQVLVAVPVFSLLGATDEPAMLDGYGPIPPSIARRLVAEGAESFHRVLVDPRDGAPLEIGRSSYRLTSAMRQWLRMRDGRCPFPGCSSHSLDNEADHILAWHQGGRTGISNLGQPCPKHHRLRHITAWKPTPASPTEPPGWISPTGRRYRSEHQDWEPPRWPHALGVELKRGTGQRRTPQAERTTGCRMVDGHSGAP